MKRRFALDYKIKEVFAPLKNVPNTQAFDSPPRIDFNYVDKDL